jgi:prolyl-tRNA synthetase
MWPVSLAPYPVHLVVLSSKDGTAEEAAEKVYQDLKKAGLEPLYDDRDERAGVKFNDADLIGLPIRVTVSARSLENGGVEVKRRDAEEKQIISSDLAISTIKDIIKEMEQEIQDRFRF